MRGDINAAELYEDREFLTRVGLGIYDVEFGSNGNVGFEDVFKFSYVENEGIDPKLYRRKVFNLVGRYYNNDVAQALWVRFHEYQALMSKMENRQVSLKEAADQWLQEYGHDFFKTWALQTAEVPFRMRYHNEPNLSWAEVVALRVTPIWRELLEAGFTVPAILLALAIEFPKRKKGTLRERYTRLVARLSGFQIKDQAEMNKRIREIKLLRRLINRQVGHNIGTRAATIEYYRRLNLVAYIEEGGSARAALQPMAA